MEITVIGATGSIGSLLVEEGLKRGYVVRAVARNPPSALQEIDSKLQVFEADALKPSQLDNAIEGSDAVLICLGSKKLTGRLRSEGTRNVVDAMGRHSVKRIVCQTTLGIGDSRANLNFYWKRLMFGILLRSVYADHGRQEEIVRNSALDWTLVRPAAFVDEPEGTCLHGFDSSAKGLSLTVARRDVATFMLDQLNSQEYLRQTPGLSYRRTA